MAALLGCNGIKKEVDLHNRLEGYLRWCAKIDSTRDEKSLFTQLDGKGSKVNYFYDGSILFHIDALGTDYCVCYVDSANVPMFHKAVKEVKQKYCEWKEIAEWCSGFGLCRCVL